MRAQKRCDSCGKRAYSDLIEARFAAAIQWKFDGIRLYIYRCPHRNGLHLTKQPGRRRIPA